MADFPLEFLLQVKNEMGTGLSQASSQLKNLGNESSSSASKVKQSGIGIGAGLSLITMNLVNTIQSLIGLKRQYEDLTRQQNNIVQSNNSLLNSKNMLKTATDKLKAAEAGTPGATARQLQEAKLQLQADMKNAKSKLDVMKAQDKYNKAINQGGKDMDKINAAQRRVENLTRRVANQTINAKEAQVNYNRAVEDFYIQTIPVAVGVIGSVASVLQVVQNSGASLIGTLTKLAIPMVAISAIFLAIKTNFLGFRDALTGFGKSLGDQIPALRPFLNVLESIGELLGLVPPKAGAKAGGGLNKAIADLKAQFGPVMDFFKNIVDDIMKGDFSKVFDRIVTAAKVAWVQLKKAFPIFGEVESLVNKIMNGNWKGAFLQIWKAATDVWKTIKKAVPILGDVETIVNDISQGKWGEAFQKIADVAKQIFSSTLGKGIEFLFGKNWISGLDAFLKLQESEASLNKRPLILQYLITINGVIKDITGIDIGKWFKDHPLTVASLGIGIGGITLLAEDPGYRDSIAKGAMTIWNALADAATGLDLDVSKWIESIDWSSKDFLTSVDTAGATLWKNIEDGIDKAAKDTDWGKIFNDAVLAIGKSKTSGAVTGALKETPLGQLLSGFGLEWTPTITPQIDNSKVFEGLDAIRNAPPPIVTPELKTDTFTKGLDKVKTDVGTLPATKSTTLKVIDNASHPTDLVLAKFKQLKDKTVTINVVAHASGLAKTMLSAGVHIGGGSGGGVSIGGGAGRAAGFHGWVSKPTTMLMGEAGKERVDITPAGKSGYNGSSGPTTIIVYSVLDGRVVAESVAKQISINQAVYR